VKWQPRWRRRLYTDADNRALWLKHYPEGLPTYDAYTKGVERADATRLLYLHVFGGLYADLDVVPCASAERTLQSALAGVDLLLVRDPWRGSLARKRTQHVSNFFMASRAAHPFWGYALRGLAARQHDRRGAMYTTGPYFISTMWKRFAREYRRCSALMARAAVLTHDEWQAAQIGAHHWLSSWHVADPRDGGPSTAERQLHTAEEIRLLEDEGYA
jgi:mannosyltransferase OCH1-like enzyme